MRAPQIWGWWLSSWCSSLWFLISPSVTPVNRASYRSTFSWYIKPRHCPFVVHWRSDVTFCKSKHRNSQVSWPNSTSGHYIASDEVPWAFDLDLLLFTFCPEHMCNVAMCCLKATAFHLKSGCQMLWGLRCCANVRCYCGISVTIWLHNVCWFKGYWNCSCCLWSTLPWAFSHCLFMECRAHPYASLWECLLDYVHHFNQHIASSLQHHPMAIFPSFPFWLHW